MEATKSGALKAYPVNLRAGDKLVPIHLFVTQDEELVGTTHPDLLREWANRTVAGVRVIPRLVSDAEARDIRLLGSEPCWFEGCEELRRAYHEEEAEMKRANPNCKSCEKGTLIRKYLKLAEEAQKR